MPFTNPGRDAALSVNVGTGKFDTSWDSTGNLAFDDSEVHRVASLTFEHRARWAFDPNGNRGSELYTLKNLLRSTPSTAVAMELRALQKAADEGAIDTVTVTARPVRVPGRLNLDIGWRVTKTGATGSLPVTIGT